MANLKYNRSEIMKEMWKIYRIDAKFGCTRGECLAMAWRNAKTKIQNEEIRKINTESFNSMRDPKNAYNEPTYIVIEVAANFGYGLNR